MIKNIRYKRIIDRDTGEVRGMLAYTTDESFERYYAGAAMMHRYETTKFDTKFGRDLACKRLPTAIADPNTQVKFSASVGVEDVEDHMMSWGLKTKSILEREKLKYVDLELIFQSLYTKLKIDTVKYR